MKKDGCAFELIAHRMNVGSPDDAAKNTVDNTLEALTATISEKNADGFECDLRLTKDNRLVVIHDGNLKALTARKLQSNVSDLSFEEVKQLSVSNLNFYYRGLATRALFLPDSKRVRKIYSQKLEKQALVPAAEDMMELLCKEQYKGKIVLELKEIGAQKADAVSELVNEYKDKLKIYVKGYDIGGLLSVSEKTGVMTGLLVALYTGKNKVRLTPEFIAEKPFDFYSVIWSRINMRLLDSISKNGKELMAWTVDSAKHMKKLLTELDYFYRARGSLPKCVSLISNIPSLLAEYESGNSSLDCAKDIHRMAKALYSDKNEINA